ncbi:hypothetical protein R2601_03518 [Salipiger bermudensis HTCC2601]|uniref:Uncharacterized protein n=1 Tax=Salipiger bermudensis (strain DSM 26914 / JCM 13377 / KCTC 12554 / HTCC2601) TaxID=314265 RepID=Q0FWE2_SALBH|nr:hypothetical protein R2601_03518 [Salipiger bermudensis HTCC2601]
MSGAGGCRAAAQHSRNLASTSSQLIGASALPGTWVPVAVKRRPSANTISTRPGGISIVQSREGSGTGTTLAAVASTSGSRRRSGEKSATLMPRRTIATATRKGMANLASTSVSGARRFSSGVQPSMWKSPTARRISAISSGAMPSAVTMSIAAFMWLCEVPTAGQRL